MSFAIQSQSCNLKATGVACTIPNNDVCRLSYYLKCGTLWCGIGGIAADLLDYSNAHKLAQSRQDMIVKLAGFDYSYDVLRDKTIILLESGDPLLKSKNNEFYKIEQVSSLIAVHSAVLIAGEQTEVLTVMVCNTKWVADYYYGPLSRLSQRYKGDQYLEDLVFIAMAFNSSLQINEESKHCGHCTGDDVSCSCTSGCPPKRDSLCHVVHNSIICDGCGDQPIKGPRYNCTTCYNYDLCSTCYSRGVHDKTHPFNEIVRAGSTPELLPPRQTKEESRHCGHCKGDDASCSCNSGCPPKKDSLCHVVHNSVTCDGCKNHSIKGPRYKCATCYDYDLCSTCYSRGVHEKTHPFNEIVRVGSTPEPLSPRETKHNYYEATAPPASEKRAPPFSPTSVVADVPVCQAVPIIDEDIEVFREGQSVRLKNMSDSSLNGTAAQVVKFIGSTRVVVHLSHQERKITVKPENLEVSRSLIPVGTVIELKNLKSQAHLNQSLGVVVDNPSVSFGRVAVQILDDEKCIISVKPENCEVIEDVS